MTSVDHFPGCKYIIGIDEAGRGPIAGPVAVGVVILPVDAEEESGFRDSKKLAQHKREQIFDDMRLRRKAGALQFTVSMTSANRIDSIGIVQAVRHAMNRALDRLQARPEECLVLLDGGLRAPKKFRYQQTIIKGDEKVYAIALASVAAKVTRDAQMRALGYRFPGYGFEQHKGYGTREHYKALKRIGICGEHRQSFLKKVLET